MNSPENLQGAPSGTPKPGVYYESTREDLQGFVPLSAQTILDLGCGVGALGAALKRRQKCFVTGIEYVPDIAARAKERLDEVICVDVNRTPEVLSDRKFDCVICGDVLEHLLDPWKVLSILKNTLSASGVLIASIPNIRHWSTLRDLLEGRWDYVDAGILDKTHVRFFTKKSIFEMFEGAGFIIDKVTVTVVRGFGVPAGVVEALRSNSIDISTLDEEAKAYQYLIVARPKKVIRDEKSIEQEIVRGENLYEAGDWNGAMNIFKEIVIDDPKNCRALNNLGVIAHQAKRFDISCDCFSRVLEIEPDHLAALENLAESHISRQNFEKAIAPLEKAIGLNPTDSRLVKILADCYQKLGLPEKAKELLKGDSLFPPQSL